MILRNARILVTGGSGTLGTELQKLTSCIAPDTVEMDITDANQCQEVITRYDPQLIIHAAAWTDVAGAEQQKEKVWAVNVTGTENIAKAAAGRRLVYISTDYVFDGERGNYTEEDTPNPQNYYALTKLMGEAVIKQYPNTLIIRTAFKKNGPWPYEKAFTDQWTSHEFVSTLAPEILQAALMTDLKGIVHIAGQRKTMYDLARRASPDVGKMSIRDASVKLPRDTSLDSSKWHHLRKA